MDQSIRFPALSASNGRGTRNAQGKDRSWSLPSKTLNEESNLEVEDEDEDGEEFDLRYYQRFDQQQPAGQRNNPKSLLLSLVPAGRNPIYENRRVEVNWKQELAKRGLFWKSFRGAALAMIFVFRMLKKLKNEQYNIKPEKYSQRIQDLFPGTRDELISWYTQSHTISKGLNLLEATTFSYNMTGTSMFHEGKQRQSFEELCSIVDGIVGMIASIKVDAIIDESYNLEFSGLSEKLVPFIWLVTGSQCYFPKQFLWKVEASQLKVIEEKGSVALLSINDAVRHTLTFIMGKIFVSQILASRKNQDSKPLYAENHKVLCSVVIRIMRLACSLSEDPRYLELISEEVRHLVFDDWHMSYIYKVLSTVIRTNAKLLREWAVIFLSEVKLLKRSLPIALVRKATYGEEYNHDDYKSF